MDRKNKIEIVNRVINYLDISFRDEKHREVVIDYFMCLKDNELLSGLFYKDYVKGMRRSEIAVKYGVTHKTVTHHIEKVEDNLD